MGEPRHPSLHVLVADDDAASRGAVAKHLRNETFRVVEADNGVSALAAIERERPDLVLTDVQMPRMGGLELCKTLHERDPLLPVVVMTAFGDLDTAVLGLRAGAKDFLAKPLDLDALMTSVQRAIATDVVRVTTVRDARASDEQDDLLAVSHDLRTPIGVVRWVAESMMQPHQTDGVRRNGERLLRSARHMARLVEDLLDDARAREGKLDLELEASPLEDILSDVADLRDLARGRGVDIEIVAPAGTGIVLACDRTRVVRVMWNLLSNAIAFSPKATTIRVTACAVSGGASFSVRDQGAGMPPDTLRHAFDRYWQSPTGASRSGLGLGLHTAKLIVEAHGGRIWAESEVGSGSTLSFFLPSAAIR